MQNRIKIALVSLFGSLCIYCAGGGLEPDHTAKADVDGGGGGGGGTGGGGPGGGTGGGTAGSCGTTNVVVAADTTPKWTKVAEGRLVGTLNAPVQSTSFDVSTYREVSLLRECAAGSNATAYTTWGADAAGFFAYPTSVNFASASRHTTYAPFLRVEANADCKYVVMGIK